MGEISKKELEKLADSRPWVFRYNELLALHDPRNNMVLLGENYGVPECCLGDTTRYHHIPRTSKIVVEAFRDGNWTFFMAKPEQRELNLEAAFSPTGIESILVEDNKIKVVYAGLGGYGVSASISRGLAEGVESVNIISEGGGHKLGKAEFTLSSYHLLTIGVDDTDNDESGATYALVKNIAMHVRDKANNMFGQNSVRILFAPEVQLYPFNPDKTKNCFASGISFAVKDGVKGLNDDYIVEKYFDMLKETTDSQKTGMSIYSGVWVTPEMMAYSDRAKREVIDTSHLSDVCQLHDLAVIQEQGVVLKEVTGQKGIIGAAAVPGFIYRPEEAGKILEQHYIELKARGDPRES